MGPQNMSHNEAKTLQKKPFFGVAVAKDSPVDGPARAAASEATSTLHSSTFCS